MNVFPHIFNNIEEALAYASRLQKSLPEDKTREMLAPCDKNEFLLNPFSGFENKASDDKFIVCRLQSGRFSLKPNLHGHRFLYRGQTKFYKRCVPSMYRDPEQDYFIEEMVQGQEEQLLMLSHPLVRLLDHGIELCGKKFVFEMNLYGLTQHYYNKTCFLDLTSDPSVAAFFATNMYMGEAAPFKPVEDGIGCIYLYQLREGIDFKGTRLSTIGLQVFPRSAAQRGFLYSMGKGGNFNDLNNVLILKFKHYRHFSEKYNKRFQAGAVLFPDDILAHHWRVYNRNPKIISSKTVMLNVSFNKGETYESISLKLRDRGYHIEDYIPRFMEEELQEYYYGVPHFWEDFCDKIYFPGDPDGILHQSLLNVKNDNRYQWAFREDLKPTAAINSGYLYNKYAKVCGLKE